ncbi:MAG: acylneuraminate cytidylyltransferase family protein [Synechococcaceae cyanobacterium]|nr:acylneuraminate cytidylyltransferase family protein [Synechococcaceae cyanobacterium]
MLAERRVLAVVPARGGSKGVPLKNLRCVAGTSLVGWAGRVAAALAAIDRAVVSTDHPGIAAEAREHGLDAPFLRPQELAGDRVADWDVLHHALVTMEQLDSVSYDVVLMLQPTSPLRRVEDVRRTLEILVEGHHDSVWTVSETDLKYHPLKQLTLVNGSLEYFDPRAATIIARQQLTPVYHRNGVAYAMTRQCLCEQRTIKGAHSAAHVITDRQVSIDTEEDLALVERLLQERDAAQSISAQ